MAGAFSLLVFHWSFRFLSKTVKAFLFIFLEYYHFVLRDMTLVLHIRIMKMNASHLWTYV